MTTPIASGTNVASVILDDEFEDIRQVLKDTAFEALEKTSAQAKNALKTSANETIEFGTTVLKEVVQANSPAPSTLVIAKCTDEFIDPAAKKIAHKSIDKCVDSCAKKAIDKGIDSSVNSTRSLLGRAYNYIHHKFFG